MNYFIDEEALEIEEKNIFTATELITLLPACGNGGLVKIFRRQQLVTSFLPHYKHRTSDLPPNLPPVFGNVRWKSVDGGRG